MELLIYDMCKQIVVLPSLPENMQEQMFDLHNSLVVHQAQPYPLQALTHRPQNSIKYNIMVLDPHD